MGNLGSSARTYLLLTSAFVMPTSSISCCQVPPDNPALLACRDELLSLLFTPQAVADLVFVPLRFGNVNDASAFASGNDFGTLLASAVYGNACERQVLVNPQGYSSNTCEEDRVRVDPLILFHEYVHQADYSGLISREEFHNQFAKMLEDPEYASVAMTLEADIQVGYNYNFLAPLTLSYDDGLTRELVAWSIERWLVGSIDLPDYILDLYRRALKMDFLESQRQAHQDYVACERERLGEESFQRTYENSNAILTLDRDSHWLLKRYHPLYGAYSCTYCPEVPEVVRDTPHIACSTAASPVRSDRDGRVDN